MNSFVNKETKLCISISNTPGNIGATIHNKAYRHLGLNYIYLPLKPRNARSGIEAVRNLNITGCSVSMPYKEEVIEYIDILSEEAEDIGAVNTIVNTEGNLKGYNTDYDSMSWALKTLNLHKDTKVLILGFGGMAKACFYACKKYFNNLPIISVRNIKKHFNKNLDFVSWEERTKINAQLVINATPIGMSPNESSSPLSEIFSTNAKSVIDVVSSPVVTRLNEECLKLKIDFIKGQDLAIMQAARQFELYTNTSPPIEIMKKSIQTLSNN